jgi:hypothetical protein
MKQKKEFRSYYQNIIDLIYEQRDKIYSFIKKAQLHKGNGTKRNKTYKQYKH